MMNRLGDRIVHFMLVQLGQRSWLKNNGLGTDADQFRSDVRLCGGFLGLVTFGLYLASCALTGANWIILWYLRLATAVYLWTAAISWMYTRRSGYVEGTLRYYTAGEHFGVLRILETRTRGNEGPAMVHVEIYKPTFATIADARANRDAAMSMPRWHGWVLPATLLLETVDGVADTPGAEVFVEAPKPPEVGRCLRLVPLAALTQ